MFNKVAESDKKQLEYAVKSIQPSHAYLFLGDDIESLNEMSYELVLQLVSAQDHDLSLEILSARIADELFTDIFIVKKEKSSIGIDSIRSIFQFIRMRPVENRFRFVIIQHYDSLTTEAQNALLKTLEEPNPSIVVILLAQTTDTLLQTVLSRVQTIRLTLPSHIDETLDPQEIESLSNILQEIVLFGSIPAIFQFSQSITKNNKDRNATIHYLEFFYRLLNSRLTQSANKTFLKELPDYMLIRMMNGITRTIAQVKQNASLQLAVEAMLINIQEDYHAENSWNQI